MLQTWFKIFVRNSKKNWLNIFINTLGLTLGLAVLLLVLLYFNDEKSYNETNPYKKDLYRLIHKKSNSDNYWFWATDIEGDIYKEHFPEIEEVYFSADRYRKTLIKRGSKEVYTEKIVLGEPNFFDFFPFDITKGNAEAFKTARNNIALSEERAKLFFGNTNPIGKTVELYDRVFLVTTIYKITGKHYFMPDAVIQYKKPYRQKWKFFYGTLFLKSKSNLNNKEFEEKVKDVWINLRMTEAAKKKNMTLEAYLEKYGVIKTEFEPIQNIRLQTKCDDAGPEGKGNYQLIILLLFLAILLLIISAVNVVNLSIASTRQRAKEVGIKKTLGLSKLQIALQYGLEIFCVCFISLVLAILIVEIILPNFNHFMEKDISIFNFQILSKIGIVNLLISLIIGSIPALYLSNFKTIEVLKGNISRGKQGVLARKVMLGLQFLISGFFLIGSIIITKQVNHIIDKELGFNADQVVMLYFYDKHNKQDKYQLAKKEFLKHKNIENVTSNSYLIGGGDNDIAGLSYNDEKVQAFINSMDYNFLDFMEIDILKGRNLNASIASDSIENVLINETLAKKLRINDDPLGKKIHCGSASTPDKKFRVVGIVKDHHVANADAKIGPIIYLHWNAIAWKKKMITHMLIKVKPNNISQTLKDVEAFWNNNIDPGYPFEPKFLDERFAKTFEKHQNQKVLFFILTSIVIVIALLGLFALATLTIQQRLKEVAIRKTLGASVKEIIIPLVKEFIIITIIASLFLLPLAYYFGQSWLNNFAYRIDMPFAPYIITPIVLILLVFFVVGIKAFNATKVDLIKYLKYE